MTTILHAVDVRPKPDERRQRAEASWTDFKRISAFTPKRTAKDIGDSRPLPYWKDLIETAMQEANPGDIICWTNDDNVLHPQLADAIRRHVAIWGVCLSHRREFKHGIPSLTDSPHDWVEKSEWHMGYDLAAFSVDWLNEWFADLPDIIIGAEQGDLYVAAMVFRTKGFLWRPNVQERTPCLELPPGLVAHEHHLSLWATQPNSPANQYNRRIFREWSAQWLPDLKMW